VSSEQERARIRTASGEVLVLRRLRGDDGPALRAFNQKLSEASRSVFLPHAYDDATLAKLIGRAETGLDLAYVGLCGQSVVAYCFLHEIGEAVPLLGIGIADAYQGQRVGTKLMETLIDDARAADREGIDLTTVRTNERAFALYRKMGFRYVGDVDNVAGDGRLVTERHMFLALEPGASPRDREFKPPV
jgi:ribosomal protein S18 acetylase RimI-like enzyme